MNKKPIRPADKWRENEILEVITRTEAAGRIQDYMSECDPGAPLADIEEIDICAHDGFHMCGDKMVIITRQ